MLTNPSQRRASVHRAAITLVLVLFWPRPSVVAQGLPARHWDLSDAFQSMIHESWTSEDGLPQNTIYSIVQTPDGFIWLGTQEGLVRFDGLSFRKFDRYNTPGITRDLVWSLALGRDTTLWVGVDHGGVLARSHGVLSDQSPSAAQSQWETRCILEDRSGRVWAVVPSQGVWKRSGGRWELLTAPRPFTDVWCAYEDADGSMWFGLRGALAHLTSGGFEWFDAAQGVPSARILKIERMRNGSLLIGTAGKGLHVLTNKRVHPLPGAAELAASTVLCLKTDPAGLTWIGVFEKGLYVYNGTSVIPVLAETHTPLRVISVMFDRESNVWFGTDDNGVHLLRNGVARVVKIDEPGASPQVWAVHARGNDLWIGTLEHGLRVHSRGRISKPPMTPALASTTVISIVEDPDGTLWVGGLTGLFRMKGEQVEELSLPEVTGLPHAVYSIFRDREGTHWIGGHRLYRYTDGHLVRVDTSKGLPGSAPVTYMLQDRSGEIWFGTDGNGVGRWNNGRMTFTTTAEGLTSNSVLCMYEDSDGGIWAGTSGGGLNRFKEGKWTSVTSANGLVNNYVNAIINDGSGTVWISTNHGILGASENDLIAVATGRMSTLTGTVLESKDGLPTPEFSGGLQTTAARTADGTIWFASQKGAVGIDPTKEARIRVAPPVHIEAVLADGKPSGLRDASMIAAGTRTLEFQFVGLSYAIPSGTRYKYRLEGYDERWVDGRTNRFATYTNLPPGTYTFRVTAAAVDGVWNETGDAVKVTILPLFWQTAWFMGLCVAIVMGAGFGLYRLRVWQLLRRERELRARVAEALSHVRVLSGLLPICSNCKKVRDDTGYWNQIDQYIRDHSEAAFSHSFCPECTEKLYGEFRRQPKGRPPEQSGNPPHPR